MFKVTVVALPGVNGFVLKLTVVPAGLPVAVKLIGVVNPPMLLLVNCVDAVVVDPQFAFALTGVLKVNPLDMAIMVMFLSLMSKKILPTASTFILPVVVGLFGTVIVSVPSFKVLSAKTIGKV